MISLRQRGSKLIFKIKIKDIVIVKIVISKIIKLELIIIIMIINIKFILIILIILFNDSQNHLFLLNFFLN